MVEGMQWDLAEGGFRNVLDFLASIRVAQLAHTWWWEPPSHGATWNELGRNYRCFCQQGIEVIIWWHCSPLLNRPQHVVARYSSLSFCAIRDTDMDQVPPICHLLRKGGVMSSSPQVNEARTSWQSPCCLTDSMRELTSLMQSEREVTSLMQLSFIVTKSLINKLIWAVFRRGHAWLQLRVLSQDRLHQVLPNDVYRVPVPLLPSLREFPSGIRHRVSRICCCK